MSHSADPNYFVDIDYADVPEEAAAFLGMAYDVQINRFANVSVLPWFPRLPWPKDMPLEPEEILTAEQAAWYVARTGAVVVAPAEDGIERLEVIRRPDVDGAQITAIWLERASFERLMAEIVGRLHAPTTSSAGPHVRLSDLDGTALGAFLRDQLPRAGFTPYERKMLALPT